MDEKWLYRIGMSLLPGVGPVLAKNLISYCGSEEAVFKSKTHQLEKIPGIGKVVANGISRQTVLSEAEAQLKLIEEKKVGVTYYLDKTYPQKLKYIADSPLILYFKGDFDFNHQRIISIVGTRKATDYGKTIVEQWTEKLSDYNVMIVSGLAYGIDIAAHKSALKNNIPTLAVLAHGLDIIYPGQHTSTAKQMIENGGGLITEFAIGSNLVKEYFPRRNRIVAGICDALIVIETKIRGGSMITAELANGYSRDVYAVPGTLNDENSKGCNHLIKTHKAQLLDDIEDLLKDKDWLDNDKVSEPAQMTLDMDFLDAETKVVFNALQENKVMEIDNLVKICKMESSKVASALLNLEFDGFVKVLPGKKYKLVKM